MAFSNELQNQMLSALKRENDGTVNFGTIDYYHNKTHEGKALFVNDVKTVANGASVYIHQVSGNSKYLHSQIEVNSIGAWRFTTYVNTTYNDAGDELTQINRKTDSDYVPQVKFYDVEVGDINTLGDLRSDFAFGSGSNPAKASGGSISESRESVFEPDLDVLIKLTNNSGSEQLLTVIFNYYEEE